ncbi:MAG: cupin domain-containing protein [Bacteroidota bacterium]|nr:cupin domain-containing protein [Bacteroidota bacterium]
MINEFNHSEVFSYSGIIDYAQGSIVSRQILQRKSGNITLFAFDKGQLLSEHTAPFAALILIIDGEAEVKINSVPYALKAGQSIIMPANIPHAVTATERFKMVLTMIKDNPE